jgi:peptidoglycan/LPS O-acetylase OafA/YrhL
MWLVRIVCEFLAGSLLFYAIDHLHGNRHARRAADWAPIVLIAAFLAFAYLLRSIGHPKLAVLVVPMLLILVGCLAVGNGVVQRFLSLRWLVIGGMASYSVYLVHMPLVEILWAAQSRFSFIAPGTIGSKIFFAVLPVVVLVAGYLLWRFFEEPARRVMRRMSLQHIPERAVDDVPPSRVD